MKFKHLVLGIVFTSVVLGACSEYNKAEVEDKNGSSERIYGEKGAPAIQSTYKYDADPNTAGQVKKIREKLYPSKK